MRVEITREQYEELHAETPSGLKLDMECKYWMEFTPAKRKPAGKRRSPLDVLEPGSRWSTRSLSPERDQTRSNVEAILFEGNPAPGEAYMASGELATELAKLVYGTSKPTKKQQSNASYAIGCLIKEKVLRIIK